MNRKKHYFRYGAKIVVMVFFVFFCLIQCVNSVISDEEGPEGLPPIVDAGGPYFGLEGEEIYLDGSGTFDPDLNYLYYRWNIEGEWAEWSIDSFYYYIWYDDYLGEVILEVSDGEYFITNSTEVVISNADPIVMLTSDEYYLEEGQEFNIKGNFWDPSPRIFCLDTHTIEIDWGDGSFNDVEIIDYMFSASHFYNSGGVYELVVTIEDDDGGVGEFSAEVFVESTTMSVDDLIIFINDLDLPKGVENSLIKKLIGVTNSLEDDKIKPAVNKLNAFINQVKALQGKKILLDDAELLISSVSDIIKELKI